MVMSRASARDFFPLEWGDVTRVMRDSLIDKKLTPREKTKIRKEIAEAKDALDDLERKVVDY